MVGMRVNRQTYGLGEVKKREQSYARENAAAKQLARSPPGKAVTSTWLGRRKTRRLGMYTMLLLLCPATDGFAISWTKCTTLSTRTLKKQPRFMIMSENNDEDNITEGGDEMSFGEDLDTGTVLIEDLSWRVEKMRLEEQNKQRFLKSSPRFLPYNECRRWVQAFGRWETEEDWRQWISMGEKRNSYIPSRPDEYYGKLGQWVSWEHFLKTDPDAEGPQQSNDTRNSV